MGGKVRIYTLAKELGLTNEETIRTLRQLGEQIDSALGSVDEDVANRLRGVRDAATVQVTKVPPKAPKERKPLPKKEGEAEEKEPKSPAPKKKAPRKKAAAPEERTAEGAAAAETGADDRLDVRVVRRGPSPEELARQKELEAQALLEEAAAADAVAALAEGVPQGEAVLPPAGEPAVEPGIEVLEPVPAAEPPVAAVPPPAVPALPEAPPRPLPETPAAAAAPAAPAGDPASAEPRLRLRRREEGAPPAPSAPPTRSAPSAPAGPRLVKKSELPAGPARTVRKIRKVITSPKLPPKTEESPKRKRRKEAVALAVSDVRVAEGMTVKELADKLQQKAKDVIAKLLEMGTMASINQALDLETAKRVVEGFGASPEVVTFEEDLMLEGVEDEKEVEFVERPPVVTIMGHVDHGKTSILDVIRSSSVAAREAGGITQHIGAYQVLHKGRTVTFLDTPGHAAFTLMRSRGAQATDIVVLVVAADDGVMPQTIEAIRHAEAAKVPVIVAMNKMDKPEAQPDRVNRQLADQGLLVEAWGGQILAVPCSAKTKEGIPELLEAILLQSELLELKAAPDRAAVGVVLEARLDRSRGPVATALVQDGTLRSGNVLLAGACFGRVRGMFDQNGNRVTEAGPATPVEVLGLEEVPLAGDSFQVVTDESRARHMAEFRREKVRRAEIAGPSRMTLDQLYEKVQQEGVKELRIVLKADVQGSVEVLRNSLEKLSTEKVRVLILHTATGPVSESDVLLASASDAIIVGFSIRPERNAQALAEREHVDIRLYTVIYEVTNEIQQAMLGLLEPEIREVALGEAQVREIFRVPKVGTVAGCMVTEGKITRSAQVRLVRDNVVVHEGRIASLRRFKDDASDVRSGFECGLALENYQDLKPGDVIQAFQKETIKVESLG